MCRYLTLPSLMSVHSVVLISLKTKNYNYVVAHSKSLWITIVIKINSLVVMIGPIKFHHKPFNRYFSLHQRGCYPSSYVANMAKS